MIPKVIFKFDKNKDLRNIWKTCNSKLSWGHDFKKNIPKEVIRICKGKKFEKCKKELENSTKAWRNINLIKIQISTLNKAWKTIEKEYFQRLKKITKKSFPCKEIYSYLTTSPRCPYNPNGKIPYFYFPFFTGLPSILHTAGHEIMHIQVHKDFWRKIKKEIGDKKTHDIKEALTILLNLEFIDLWGVVDRGYPNHQKLREYIKKQWKKKKDFNILLDKCIKYIKNNNDKRNNQTR